MAISAYIGIPGSGKSYEVMKSVILPALAKGRRIVTNIYGIHDEQCKQFLLNSGRIQEEHLGTIIHVSNEQVEQPRFFPDMDDSQCFCKHGDLIILDEVHRFFGVQLTTEQKNFIAEHRHYADRKTGIACDLVVVTQALPSLARFLRDRIETTYRMRKLNHLGLSRRYRVDVYCEGKMTKTSLLRSYQNKYDPKIFTLYDSNTVKNAREEETDKRGNYFSATSFWVLLVVIIVGITAASFIVYGFFHPDTTISDKPEKQATSVIHDVNTLPVQENVQVIPPTRTDWCIAGTLFYNGHNYVLLTDSQHHIRMAPRKDFSGEGTQISGMVDGMPVNTWSCQDSVSGHLSVTGGPQ